MVNLFVLLIRKNKIYLLKILRKISFTKFYLVSTKFHHIYKVLPRLVLSLTKYPLCLPPPPAGGTQAWRQGVARDRTGEQYKILLAWH